MRYFVMLLFVVLFSFNQAIGQLEKVYYQVDEKMFVMGTGEGDSYNNQAILNLVVQCAGQPAKITYAYKEHKEITLNNQSHEVQVAVGNFLLVDDYVYKTFDINNYLLPEKISYKLEIKADGNPVQVFSDDLATFKSGKNIVKKMLPVIEGGNIEIVFSSLRFDFEEKQVKKLTEYIETIDKYYDADAQLALIYAEISALPIDSIELLQKHLQLFKKNEEAFKEIKSQRFASKLHLAAHDPLKIISRLGMVSEKNKELRKKVELSMGEMYRTYYLKGIQLLEANNRAGAKARFMESYELKPDYAPTRYELTYIKYIENGEKEILLDITEIVNTLSLDNDTRYNCYQLAEKIVLRYISSAKQYIKELQPQLAKPLLDTCDVYTQKIDGFRKFPELNEVKTQYYQSLFEFIIHQGEIQLEAQALNESLVLADSAYRFKGKYNGFSFETEKLGKLLFKLYVGNLEKADEAIQDKSADLALQYCSQVQGICKKYPLVDCTTNVEELFHKAHAIKYSEMLDVVLSEIDNNRPDSALQGLETAQQYRKTYTIDKRNDEDGIVLKAYQIKYISLVSKGNAAQNTGKHKEALSFYKEAEAIGGIHAVQKDDDLPNKMANAAQGYIFQLCDEGAIFVETLNLKRAGANLNKAVSLKEKYIASTNAEVETAVNQFKTIYDQGNCNQAMHKFNVQIRAAKKFIGEKEFIYATKAFKKAITIAEKNTSCIIPDTLAQRQLSDIRAIYKYQVKINRIEESIEAKEFAEAIDDYIVIERYYEDSCENSFGIEHKEAFHFISSHRNGQLADYAIQFYIEKGDGSKALELLHALYSKEYIKTWSKESQVKLGQYLAQNDFEENANANPKIKVLQYMKNDKWYRYLKKAYLKEWKSQKKIHEQIDEDTASNE
jgi:hypothetical protein